MSNRFVLILLYLFVLFNNLHNNKVFSLWVRIKSKSIKFIIFTVDSHVLITSVVSIHLHRRNMATADPAAATHLELANEIVRGVGNDSKHVGYLCSEQEEL